MQPNKAAVRRVCVLGGMIGENNYQNLPKFFFLLSLTSCATFIKLMLSVLSL